MKLIPTDGPTVQTWSVEHDVPNYMRTYPDGTQEYNPGAEVVYWIEAILTNGEIHCIDISPYDAECMDRLSEIESCSPFGKAGDYARNLMAKAGLALPEYEFDENDL